MRLGSNNLEPLTYLSHLLCQAILPMLREKPANIKARYLNNWPASWILWKFPMTSKGCASVDSIWSERRRTIRRWTNFYCNQLTEGEGGHSATSVQRMRQRRSVQNVPIIMTKENDTVRSLPSFSISLPLSLLHSLPYSPVGTVSSLHEWLEVRWHGGADEGVEVLIWWCSIHLVYGALTGHTLISFNHRSQLAEHHTAWSKQNSSLDRSPMDTAIFQQKSPRELG